MIAVLQGLHVLFGILWFGAVAFNDFVVVPAVGSIEPEHGNAFVAAYARLVERYLNPVGGLTLLTGIVLGFALGAWSDIGHLYGDTYLIAFALALGLFFLGLHVIAPHGRRLGRLVQGSPEFTARLARLT